LCTAPLPGDSRRTLRFKRPIARERVVQPLIAPDRRIRRAFDDIRLAEQHAALRGGHLDEVLGRVDAVPREQKFVRGAYMILGGLRVVSAAVAIE
jgi:predicted nuclease of restriction endonuclease-like RecB superfamily